MQAACSWCYKYGHKRPTCPEYREYLEREEKSECLSPREATALKKFRNRDAGKRITSKVTKSDDRRKKSACSFCGSKEHNIRKCTAMAKVKQDYAVLNQAFRAMMEPVLSNYGTGSLVSGGKWHEIQDDQHRDTKKCKQEYSFMGMVTGLEEERISFGQMIVDSQSYSSDYLEVQKLSHNDMIPNGISQSYHHIYQAPIGNTFRVTLDWHEFYASAYKGCENVERHKTGVYADGYRDINYHKRCVDSIWSDLFSYENTLFSGNHGDHCDVLRPSRRRLSMAHVVSPANRSPSFLTSRDPMEGFDVLYKLYTERAKKRKVRSLIYVSEALISLSMLIPEKTKLEGASETLIRLRQSVFDKYRKTVKADPKRLTSTRYQFYGLNTFLSNSYM